MQSDDTTHNLVFRKIFGIPVRASAPTDEAQAAARREAAAKVAANRTAVMGDILKNSGIVRGRSNQYGNTLQARALHAHRVHTCCAGGCFTCCQGHLECHWGFQIAGCSLSLLCCCVQSANGYPMEPSPAAVAAVEWALRRLCSYLVHGASCMPVQERI